MYELHVCAREKETERETERVRRLKKLSEAGKILTFKLKLKHIVTKYNLNKTWKLAKGRPKLAIGMLAYEGP